ncbi:hypothetical protein IF1G_06175 [Cordyceps javanica]|uniref:Uncharacterized protein n=1 Tax=Cordyceps javanica TaxID=43265 RepID=A0A545V0D9_9HYPO|nr:hypothetical protein IF1G_06175 [Cordyceps javanica]
MDVRGTQTERRKLEGEESRWISKGREKGSKKVGVTKRLVLLVCKKEVGEDEDCVRCRERAYICRVGKQDDDDGQRWSGDGQTEESTCRESLLEGGCRMGWACVRPQRERGRGEGGCTKAARF